MTDSAPWITCIIIVPLVAAILCFLLPRGAAWLGALGAGGTVLSAAGLAAQVLRAGAQGHAVGGWRVPLGIELRADGLSALLVGMTALVGVAVSIYAAHYFADAQAEATLEEQRHQRRYFWPLWMFLWAALNALFVSGDLFNLYVTLEMLGLSAVALVALAGGRAAVVAAMRYLLVSLLGSLAYLMGVALIYANHATVDIASLTAVMQPGPPAWAALALMTTGLLMKTALFPLHFWLPPAHGHAPAPVSAVLSALVVKASFYILLRLWFGVFAGVATPGAHHLLGLLGAAAIVWGSVQALRQQRLKLVVAYSTVAQLGYLFLLFPLAQAAGAQAWEGCLLFVLAHAIAKAAMFLAAGNILHAAGHDRIAELDGIAQALPLSVSAFTLAGVSLIGLPLTGGFIAKWLLLNAAITGGQWGWVILILAGSLLAAGYVLRVLWHAFTPVEKPRPLHRVPRTMEWTSLALALVAALVGLMPSRPLELLRVGAPVVNAAVTPDPKVEAHPGGRQ